MINISYKQIAFKYSFILVCILIFTGCNKEWEGEQYEKYISFVHTGVNQVYLKYENDGGKITYKLPVQVSGSEMPENDIHVTVLLDEDTVALYNYETFRAREDLYYKELEEKYYNVQSWSTVIPAGESKGYLYVDFELEGLDLYNNYFLPLQISPSSDLAPNPKKHYKKSLIQVVPFNNYSGFYSVAGEIEIETGEVDKNGQPVTETFEISGRNSWLYDENTIFFYAGLTDEKALDRRDYIVHARFIPTDEGNGLIEMWSNNPDIDFDYIPAQCTYVVAEMMDAQQPYLKRVYTTLNLNYNYLDITNPSYPLRYQFSGSMVMERLLNIHMPEEDQIIWNN